MKSKIAIIIFFTICTVLWNGYSQELSPTIKIYKFAPEDNFLINWKWITVLDYKKISDWAKVYHCAVNYDDKPVLDGSAWFISKYGSLLVFDNLDDIKYYLHINFVTFDHPEKTSIDALCVIYCNDKPVQELSFKDMTIKNSRIVLEISREFIVNKTLTVEFKEYSSAGGFFGVWDVILSKEDTLPDVIEMKKATPKTDSMKQSPVNLLKPKSTTGK
ncbi:MAG: hypothetical protein N3F66_10530 [Spirochaetes bacterium]|nr:hypothetical protein [Spirochaetota bacterium]